MAIYGPGTYVHESRKRERKCAVRSISSAGGSREPRCFECGGRMILKSERDKRGG